jgi:hypothetical protein
VICEPRITVDGDCACRQGEGDDEHGDEDLYVLPSIGSVVMRKRHRPTA